MDDVSDKQADQKPTEPPPDDLKAAETAARDALISAFLAWGDARWRQGYRAGFEESRERAKKILDQVIADAVARTPVEPTPAAPAHGSRLLTGLVSRPERATTLPPKAAVLQAIKAYPGLRGADVLKKIHESGNPLHERTFRTNLARLKPGAGKSPKEGNIVAYRNLWYAWPDVPEGYQHVLPSGDEAAQPPDPQENGDQ